MVSIDISENVPCCSGSGYCWNTTSTHNSYNSIGHPTVHKGSYLFWSNGKNLASYDGTHFTYASTGMRLTKGNNITYEYEGDKLIKETRGTTKIEYLHGANGIIGFRYSGTNYYYIKNAFGDVTSVIDHVGRIYAEYIYDAFGNCTITYDPYGIGSLNPIRYRSYYYDTETGLYYLKTRYYDPEIGRFISPAETSALNTNIVGGLNLYAYTFFSPVDIAYNNSAVGGNSSIVFTNSKNGVIASNKTKVASKNSINVKSGFEFKLPKANSVLMTHYTTSLIENAFIGGFFGNISYTTTKQLNESGKINFYSNTGNGYSSIGISINPFEWFGISGYFSENIGIGFGVQTTPWITSGMEVSLFEGISLNAGIILGDTTHELSVNIGWGPIICYALATAFVLSPIPGGRLIGGTLALIGASI